MRYALVIALVMATLAPQGAANEELVGSWYPILQAGNTWVYAEESRDADNGHGIADPTVGRWTTTETVSNVEVLPEGTRVTIQANISDLVRLKGWEQDPSLMTPPQIELLVRGNCIYRLETAEVSYPDDLWSAYDANHAWRPEFQRALARNDVPPAYCFPMKVGADWGRVPSKEDEDDIWHVKRLNGDPFGTPGARTFHVYGYQGSGDTTDYWFQQGVGVVQFIEEHHGTYDWHQRILVSAKINDVTQAFTLQPARTPPLEPGECRDGSRHWVREDGSLIPDLSGCIAYGRTRAR